MSKYPIVLTNDQRDELRGLIGRGKAPARKLTHARVLLKADQGLPDAAIAAALDIHPTTAWRVRRRFTEEGFASALAHKHPARLKPPRLDGRAEAHLIALACSDPPAGRARWTLRLLAAKLVELELVPGVSPETVRRALKKNELAPHLKRQWCIPPGASGAFVCAMEDVLDLYERPYDPARPVVCFDERPCQLIAEARPGTAPAPGRPARDDDEWEREQEIRLTRPPKPAPPPAPAPEPVRRRTTEEALADALASVY